MAQNSTSATDNTTYTTTTTSTTTTKKGYDDGLLPTQRAQIAQHVQDTTADYDHFDRCNKWGWGVIIALTTIISCGTVTRLDSALRVLGVKLLMHAQEPRLHRAVVVVHDVVECAIDAVVDLQCLCLLLVGSLAAVHAGGHCGGSRDEEAAWLCNISQLSHPLG